MCGIKEPIQMWNTNTPYPIVRCVPQVQVWWRYPDNILSNSESEKDKDKEKSSSLLSQSWWNDFFATFTKGFHHKPAILILNRPGHRNEFHSEVISTQCFQLFPQNKTATFSISIVNMIFYLFTILDLLCCAESSWTLHLKTKTPKTNQFNERQPISTKKNDFVIQVYVPHLRLYLIFQSREIILNSQ